MSAWTDLIAAYRAYDEVTPDLKIASLAQWILESGRGSSVLAREHLNFGGIKFRQRMAGYATAVDYTGSDREPEVYCAFDTVDRFIIGYWHFIESGPYKGFQEYSNDALGYLRFIALKGYASDRDYARKVASVFAEAGHLLGLSLRDTAEEAGDREEEPDRVIARARRSSSTKICIDPGHGMSNRRSGLYDPGTTHSEGETLFKEADVALKYGLTLKDVLRSRGVSVFMTRDDDTDHAPVGQRARNAEDAGCDLLVSFHLNAAGDGNDEANGVEVLYRDDEDAALAKVLRDAVALASGIKRRSNKKRNDLAVLKFEGAAVLIELGFLANDEDRIALLNPNVRSKICDAIGSVIGSVPATS